MSTATDDSSSHASTETVYIPRPRIYLQLLESLEPPVPNGTQRTTFHQVNAQLVALKAPKGERMYSFRHIFQPSEEENLMFEEVGRPVIQQLIKGQSPLVLMQGNVARLGEQNILLDNCLEELFQCLPWQLAPHLLLQWNGQDGFELSRAIDSEKDGIGNFDHSSEEGVFRCCSVFVSYLEIYNNSIYDLLSMDQVESKPLLMREFCQKSETIFYPSSCNHFEIRSASEGLRMLLQGQESLRRLNARINAQKQRCHTAYTISLVQAELVQQGSDGDFQLNQQDSIQWSQVTFVDLAAAKSERFPQDNSLLMLRECLKQLQRGEKFSSHRQSKLTQLLARQLKQPNGINLLFSICPPDDLCGQNLQLLEVAELPEIKGTQAKANTKDFDSAKLKCLLDYRCQQQQSVKLAAQRLRLDFMSIDNSISQLRTDNSALLCANRLHTKQFGNMDAKLRGQIEFSNQLLGQLNQARRDIKDLRAVLCNREKQCSVQEQTIAIAKDRIKRMRRSHENREQHLVSMQTSKVTQLRVQLQLKEEELKKLRRQEVLNECSDIEGVCEKKPYETKSPKSYASRTKALVAKTIACSFRKSSGKNSRKDL